MVTNWRVEMNKNKTVCKGTACMVFCTLMAFILVCCLLAMAVLTSFQIFGEDDSRIRERVLDKAAENFALIALADRNGNYADDRLKDTNCRYGVIEGDIDTEKLDLNDPKIYLHRNFTGNVPKDHQTLVEYISDSARFVTSSDRLFELSGERRNRIIDNSQYITETSSIKGIGYDLIGERAYVWDDKNCYKLDGEVYFRDTSDTKGTANTNKIYSLIWEKNRKEVSFAKEGALYINGEAYSPVSATDSSFTLILQSFNGNGRLSAENIADLSEIHDKLEDSDIKTAELSSISTIEHEKTDKNVKAYTFISFPTEKIAKNGDFYAQAYSYIKKLPIIQWMLPLGAVISGILFLLTFIMFIKKAGNVNEKGEICLQGSERIPWDLGAFLLIFFECVIVIVIEECFESELDPLSPVFFMVLVSGIVAGIFAGMLWLKCLVVNIKVGKGLVNTLIYRIVRMFAGLLAKSHKRVRETRRSVKMTIRVWMYFAVITFIEFIILVMFEVKGGLYIRWIIEKIMFALFIKGWIYQFAQIKNKMLDVAAGNLDANVDTKGMYIDFEEEGKALNEIRGGINIAINDRLKSERMKTELITNVSHDIKTPLTSIINYVDIIKKEGLDSPETGKYLDVLDRQASRLKKLIEDLIEASKAATGNIKFNMEKVNARIILNQSIGEFEERLQENEIELISTVPEEDIFITADNRYLWRVFENLMSNISKYAMPHTRAYIDLVDADGNISFIFRNISRDRLNISADELMERFVRGDSSRNKEGNGLGLSIASSLAKSMGGDMKITIDGDLFKASVLFTKQV